MACDDIDVVFTGEEAHADSRAVARPERPGRDGHAAQLDRVVAAAAQARRTRARRRPRWRDGRQHHPSADRRPVHGPQRKSGVLRGDEETDSPNWAKRRPRRRITGEITVVGRLVDDAPQPRRSPTVRGEHRGERPRRRGRRPDRWQHGYGQRQPGLPGDPPGARRSARRAWRTTRSGSATQPPPREPTTR